MMNRQCCHWIVRCWLLWSDVFLLPLVARGDVTATQSDRAIVIKIDGKLFTEYRFRAGHAPAMWPIIGPTGKPVTRSYPFTAAAKDGTHDHPHHQSLWFTADKVNGVDFWAANVNDNKVGGPQIVQRELIAAHGGRSSAQIVTFNDWMSGDKRVCKDQRNIVIGTGPNDCRWIDFTIQVLAPDADVTFGDTKEGAFALRVADSMRVDAKKGGRIVNSEGLVNEAAWGMPARWVDYTGPVDIEIVGIAVMSHPKSFRPLPRWHVRTYGLFAANPFGQKDFLHPEAAKQGAVTIKKGKSITLRYRVFLHRGKTDVEEIERAFREFAAK
jgi:hypothetical protein